VQFYISVAYLLPITKDDRLFTEPVLLVRFLFRSFSTFDREFPNMTLTMAKKSLDTSLTAQFSELESTSSYEAPGFADWCLP
jgi:hypothetical protein